MSRRARAVAFGALALVCATLAASVAGEYRGGISEQLGELRPVVVARAEIPAGRPLRPRDAKELLEVRRVPSRFAPVDGLAGPLEAVGRQPRAPIPAGSYVTAAQLRLPGGAARPPRARVGPGLEAVEITVAGAEALAASGADPTGEEVDVVVTSEPRPGGGAGRTYVAAEGVRLLALRESGAGPDAGGLGPGGPSAWIATVAASRSQSLQLIQAHNYAREVRLIVAAGR